MSGWPPLTHSALIWAALAAPLLAALWVVLRPGSVRLSPFLCIPPLLALLVAACVPQSFEVSANWLLLGARLGMDGLTATMLVLTALVWAGAGLALPVYAGPEMTRRIAPAWLLALAGNVALVLALDQVTFFVSFTLMSFAAYALVVARGDTLAMSAGRRYMMFVIVGEVMLFNALVLQGAGHDAIRALLLLIGFGIKAALLGLHVWLPLAHTAAPAPASAVLSGSMVAAGTVGWLRFVEPDALPEAATVLAVVGLAGALYASMLGLLQRHPKAVLAYSSVAQLGLIAIAVAAHLNGYAGAAALATLYLLHHGLAKAALFVGVAMMERLRGSARRLGMVGLLLMAATIIGLPGTSGAGLKVTLKAASLDGLPIEIAGPVSVMLTVVTVGSTLLMARFLWLLAVPAQHRAVPGPLVAGFGLLAASSVVVAGVLPAPSSAHVPSLLLPCAIGLTLAVAGRGLSALGALPRLRPGATEGAHDGAVPGSLLLLSIAPAVYFPASQSGGFPIARERLQRLLERFGVWAQRAEESFRRWALPCAATGLIALFAAAEFGLR